MLVYWERLPFLSLLFPFFSSDPSSVNSPAHLYSKSHQSLCVISPCFPSCCTFLLFLVVTNSVRLHPFLLVLLITHHHRFLPSHSPFLTPNTLLRSSVCRECSTCGRSLLITQCARPAEEATVYLPLCIFSPATTVLSPPLQWVDSIVRPYFDKWNIFLYCQ